jgi:tRNA-dihydrouridine synthase A
MASCSEQLQQVDGVMVGRAAYDHPLRWATVDRDLFNDSSQPMASASTVVRGLMPYAERWCNGGGRLWAIARHLVQVVEGVSGARHWRRDLGQAAGARDAGPEVLERAAVQLEERGL